MRLPVLKYPVRVVVGGKKIVHSQLVHLKGQDEFKVYLGEWYCRIRLKNDGNGSRYSALIEDNILCLDLYNHNNHLDETIFEPFVIAGSEEGDIYMTYSTHIIDPTLKIRAFEFVLWMDE